MSYRPHLPGLCPTWGSNRRPSRKLLASYAGRMVCNEQRDLCGLTAAVKPLYSAGGLRRKGQVSPKCRRRLPGGRGAAAGYNTDSHSPPEASNYDHLFRSR